MWGAEGGMRPVGAGRWRTALAVLALLVFTAGLAGPASAAERRSGPPPATGAGHQQAVSGHHGRAQLRVATYNLYLGADLTPLLQVTDPAALPAAAASVYAQVLRTDFPSRAQALAGLIAGAEPDVVGLQEVALWETADLAASGGEVHFTPALDYLAILLDDLAATGHPYRAVATSVNFSTAGIGPGGIPISATTLVSFTDRDVILVRADREATAGGGSDRSGPSDRTSEPAPPKGTPGPGGCALAVCGLEVTNSRSATFATALTVQLGGQAVTIPRGWSSVDLTVRGRTVRFVTTHLEAFSPEVRAAQATELAQVVADSPVPVVLVGDVNSSPDDATGAYGLLTGAGLVDSWSEAMPNDPGFTSGQQADLSNDPSELDNRIDVVLHSAGVTALPNSGDVLGDDEADRAPSGLWPSDHAGVAITLRIGRSCGWATWQSAPGPRTTAGAGAGWARL